MTKKIQEYPYLWAMEPFPPEELSLIAQVKRLFECTQGDPDFRDDLASGSVSAERRDYLKRIGVTFELDEVAVAWENPETMSRFMAGIGYRFLGDLPEELPEALNRSRPLRLWAQLALRRARIGRELFGKTVSVTENPAFDAWRSRRIASARSELGFFGLYIDHPTLAFELGDGCSVGCWFCAFATRKLKENFDYREHRELFRGVAQSCVDLFGKDAANAALPYYGTEPHDNPHYLDFIKDYAEITGGPVCTSTAVPTDTKWMRGLLTYYREWGLPWPRLSVLSKGMLRKIHELYSPDELRDTAMLMQMRDQPRPKVTGGRILEEQDGLRGRDAGNYLDACVPQGSISCVSGFLTNMVRRTIQVVSPCYTSERWPYGYRVHDELTFNDAEDFPRVVEQLIDRNMPNSPPEDMPARFRDDLVYRATDEGFDLTSPNQVHHFGGKKVYGVLGSLLTANGLTYRDLYETMTGIHGINPMVTLAAVKKLFDGGFLDEVGASASR